MNMLPLLLFSILLTKTLATNQTASDAPTSGHIHLLRPQAGSHGRHVPGVSCMSWRLGVETHSILNWTTIPSHCERYIGNYMQGHQYRQDSRAVTNEAFLYAKSLNLTKDGKELWVFDIDETVLSNLPYYAHNGFGVEEYNASAFNAWVLEGRAPALPESLKLYNKFIGLGIRIAFLSGREESQRTVTEINLKFVGYLTWEKLILRNSTYYDANVTSGEYKQSERIKLEESGYRIIGNIGDQWSDLLGTNVGNRTFKLPDPMYYVN